jgi:hypothetical protein
MTKKWDEEHKEQMREYFKRYRDEHKEHRCNYNKQYRAEHIEQEKQYSKQYRDNHREQIKQRMKRYCQKPEVKKQRNESVRKYQIKIKKIIVNHYTKGKMKCELCPEDTWEIFELHHPELNGKKDRENVNGATGTKFYRWVIKNNFPKGYMILCPNCHAKEHNKNYKEKERERDEEE